MRVAAERAAQSGTALVPQQKDSHQAPALRVSRLREFLETPNYPRLRPQRRAPRQAAAFARVIQRYRETSATGRVVEGSSAGALQFCHAWCG